MRKLAAVAFAIGIVGILAGCTGTQNDQQTQDLPKKNIDLWVMPLDAYALSNSDVVSRDYAENLLISPCMSEAGFDFPVPWLNLDALQGPSFNSVGTRLHTMELATKYGYQVAPNPDPSAQEWAAIVASTPPMTSEEDAVFLTCLDKAREEVHLLPDSAQLANLLTNDAFVSAHEDSSVKAAVEDWKTCMRPQGISDLPETPSEMPPSSLAEKYGLNQVGGASSISREEIEMATADAQCQENAGYRQALYDAEWELQVQSLNSNADDLQRAAEAIQQLRSEIDEIVATHAPAH